MSIHSRIKVGTEFVPYRMCSESTQGVSGRCKAGFNAQARPNTARCRIYERAPNTFKFSDKVQSLQK